MKLNINKELKTFIEAEIIPLYETFDPAHQTNHVRTVIKESMILARQYDVNPNMVYTIAAFHDIGLKVDRETHHLVSGSILRNSPVLLRFFTVEEIETMAQATEDHRASIHYEPRSIYGKIVAEADRCIDKDVIVTRAIQYGLSHYPTLNKEEHFARFLDHMKEKYSEHGYIKIWLPGSTNAHKLKEFQQYLKNDKNIRDLFNKHWKELSL